MPRSGRERTKPGTGPYTTTRPLARPPLMGESIDDLFQTFGKYLRNGDIQRSLSIMFPGSFSPAFITNLITHCRKPLVDIDVEMHSQKLDEGNPQEAEMMRANPGEEINKRHASALIYNISEIGKQGTLNRQNSTYTIENFYSENKIPINGLKQSDIQLSLNAYANIMAENLKESNAKMVDKESVKAPLPEFVNIKIKGTNISIKVDRATAEFMEVKAKEIISGKFETLVNGLKRFTTASGYILIQIGTITMSVSAHALLWSVKYLYDLSISYAGRFQGYLNKAIEGVFNIATYASRSPFMNFNDPEAGESRIRRTNRIVYIYLYAMIDLLLNIRINNPLRVHFGGEFQDLFEEEFETFITAEGWNLDDIFVYGPKLFNYIWDDGPREGLNKYLYDYYVSYGSSIWVVTHLLDLRIFDAKIKLDELTPLLTPSAIAKKAQPIRKATPSEVAEIQGAIPKLESLGMINDSLRLALTGLGYMPPTMGTPGASGASELEQQPEPEPEPEFGAIKKITRRRRRKSKGNSYTKGKKKKGKKGKQTKRGRKKK